MLTLEAIGKVFTFPFPRFLLQRVSLLDLGFVVLFLLVPFRPQRINLTLQSLSLAGHFRFELSAFLILGFDQCCEADRRFFDAVKFLEIALLAFDSFLNAAKP